MVARARHIAHLAMHDVLSEGIATIPMNDVDFLPQCAHARVVVLVGIEPSRPDRNLQDRHRSHVRDGHRRFAAASCGNSARLVRDVGQHPALAHFTDQYVWIEFSDA
jgi:hypothetical protein